MSTNPYTEERQQAHNKKWYDIASEALRQLRGDLFAASGTCECVYDIQEIGAPEEEDDAAATQAPPLEVTEDGHETANDDRLLREVFFRAGRGELPFLVALYLSGRLWDEKLTPSETRTFVPFSFESPVSRSESCRDPVYAAHDKYAQASQETCIALALSVNVPDLGDRETDDRFLQNMVGSAARTIDSAIEKMKAEQGTTDTSCVVNYVELIEEAGSWVGYGYAEMQGWDGQLPEFPGDGSLDAIIKRHTVTKGNA